MSKNKYVTEAEFDAIKKLMLHYSNADIASFGRAGLVERSDTTLQEIRRTVNFRAYQTRRTQPMATVIVNGTKFEGTADECIKRLERAVKAKFGGGESEDE